VSASIHMQHQPKAPFLDGMARLIDLGGNFCKYKSFKAGGEADLYVLQKDWEAIWGDWEIVWHDFYLGTCKFAEEMETATGSQGGSMVHE